MEVDPHRNAVLIGLLALALVVGGVLEVLDSRRRPHLVGPTSGACASLREGQGKPVLELFCTGRLPVNEAGEEDLTRLDGIGPARARAIVRYRDAHGPFTSARDLQNVRGIGPATAEKLAPVLLFGDRPRGPTPR